MSENVATEQPDSRPAQSGKGRRRRLIGRVTSDRMQKTITVVVERLVKHPLYGKYVRRSTKLHVHDEEQSARIGDQVEIEECRPISKTKAWRLIRVVSRAESA
ncbi:MAG: 30S ribosomal protein S17 [Gammaproteobacteria bacterium]|nr:MAG: 30S ribosomal protein S17 [Gammaproteobacteria bacterium]